MQSTNRLTQRRNLYVVKTEKNCGLEETGGRTTVRTTAESIYFMMVYVCMCARALAFVLVIICLKEENHVCALVLYYSLFLAFKQVTQDINYF